MTTENKKYKIMDGKASCILPTGRYERTIIRERRQFEAQKSILPFKKKKLFVV